MSDLITQAYPVILLGTIAIEAIAIAGVLICNRAGDRRCRGEMRRTWGDKGFSPAWTAINGRRYRYDLTRGVIVPAE